ncbi:coiled-coil domain-containing protein 125 isoform X1 [Arapaima gigas]
MQVGGDQAEIVPGRPLEDDMMEGDLGDGLGKKPGGLYNRTQQVLSGGKGDALQSVSSAVVRNKGSEDNAEAFAWTSYGSLHAALRQDLQIAQPWKKINDTASVGDLSHEELQNRLQEVTEEIELLRCELEATQRHLEGKHEALKILQSRVSASALSPLFFSAFPKAVFDKATTHIKTLLEKSEERTKALEKEVNALQWEITFNQAQFKNVEQSWQEKYDRICAENKALSNTVDESVKEAQELRSENSSLSQRCLELMALLSAQEKRAFQGSLPPFSSLGRDEVALELAVLGACHCNTKAGEPCPCARTSAASRKQVIQLKQEVEVQRMRKEEAYVMSDAFRIAFEQQLKRRSEEVLCFVEKEGYLHKDTSSGHKREVPLNRSSGTVAQKIRGMLQSSAEGRISQNLAETLHHLVDLLNDKEEALAHQRKVSHVLARKTEELEQQLLQLKGLDCGMTDQSFQQKLGLCKDDDIPPSLLPFTQSTPGEDTDTYTPSPTEGKPCTETGTTVETGKES